ncbi:hypothetical protein TELCIR_05974 [Teladorsagia circumcincta]|uniref:Uncharacterized protein n=1 Tax=Teladorsagia circumcincta TaxID=45464 RepID=A0A2G9UPD2_TELCI|nr:hypothetical protein TELCIR_05974 [Teladorsagia circumcincta]
METCLVEHNLALLKKRVTYKVFTMIARWSKKARNHKTPPQFTKNDGEWDLLHVYLSDFTFCTGKSIGGHKRSIALDYVVVVKLDSKVKRESKQSNSTVSLAFSLRCTGCVFLWRLVEMGSAASSGSIDNEEPVFVADRVAALLNEKPLKMTHMLKVANHMELLVLIGLNYRSSIRQIDGALLETAASMATIPALVPYLVKPHTSGAKSIAKELLVPFSDIMFAYTSTWKCQMGSPDVRMAILEASHEYEQSLPLDERIRTPVMRPPGTESEVSLSWSSLVSTEEKQDSVADVAVLYRKALKHLQVQSHK